MDNSDFFTLLKDKANAVLNTAYNIMKLFRLDPVLNAEERFISCNPNEVLPVFLGCYVELLPRFLHMRFNLPFTVENRKEDFACAVVEINNILPEGAFFFIPGSGHAYFKISSLISDGNSGRSAIENMLRTVSRAMKVITPLLQKLEAGEVSIDSIISEVNRPQIKTVSDIYSESFSETTFKRICDLSQITFSIPEKQLAITSIDPGKYSKLTSPIITSIFTDEGSRTIIAEGLCNKRFPDKVKGSLIACVISAQQYSEEGYVRYHSTEQRFRYRVSSSIRDGAFEKEDCSAVVEFCIGLTGTMIVRLDEYQCQDIKTLEEYEVKDDERFPFI